MTPQQIQDSITQEQVDRHAAKNAIIDRLEAENAALKQQVEPGKRDAVPEDIRKDAERWRAIVAEAERDYVEVPSHEEPYWQRLECTEAMEEWADAAITAAPKQEN